MTIETILSETHRRRQFLLNDPNYGLILSFLGQFQMILNIPKYPLQLLEDHLIQHQEEIPSALIDFHLTLLKRVSIARNAKPSDFNNIIAKFAARFDQSDAQVLIKNGYLSVDIRVKLRILKNLLERQLDLNRTVKKFLSEKSAAELRASPTGRDRFGNVYWLFTDINGFVRLFLEQFGDHQRWTHVAKNQSELEKFIQRLVNDSIFRQKFPDFTVDDSLLLSWPISNEFMELYSQNLLITSDDVPIETSMNIDEENCVKIVSKKPLRRSKKRSHSSSESSSIDSSEEEEFYDSNSFEMEFENEMNDKQTEPSPMARTAGQDSIVRFCCICHENDRPEMLLLCDQCDDGFHLDCLTPCLFVVPLGPWFCPLCEHQMLANILIENYQNLNKKPTKKNIEEDQQMLPVNPCTDKQPVVQEILSVSQRGRRRRHRFNPNEINDEMTNVDHPAENQLISPVLAFLNDDNPCLDLKFLTTRSAQTNRISSHWRSLKRRQQTERDSLQRKDVQTTSNLACEISFEKLTREIQMATSDRDNSSRNMSDELTRKSTKRTYLSFYGTKRRL